MFLSRSRTHGARAHGAPSNGSGPLPDALRDDPRVIGRLKDRMQFRSDDGFVGACVGDAVLVDSLESALALHRVHPVADYLSPTGEVVYASGLIAVGGRSAGDLGLLAHNRKMAEAQAQLADRPDHTGLDPWGHGLRRDAVGWKSELVSNPDEISRR